MDRHKWDERYGATTEGRSFPDGPTRLVVGELESLPPARALDLATGEGRHAVWLAGLGWHVVAVDFSAVGLSRGRAWADDLGVHVALVQADVHDLRLPPERFELVLASFFHPRPATRPGLFERITAALAPGGVFLTVGYDEANLTEGTGGPKDPELLIRTDELSRELEKAGLSVERADTVPLRTTTRACVAGTQSQDGSEVDVVNAVVRAVKPG